MPAPGKKPSWLSEETRLALQIPTLVAIFVSVVGGGVWLGKMWSGLEQQQAMTRDLQQRVYRIEAIVDKQREMCLSIQVLLRYQVPAEARPPLSCERTIPYVQ